MPALRELRFDELAIGDVFMAVEFAGGWLNLRHEKVADDLALVCEKFWAGAAMNGELVHVRGDAGVTVMSPMATKENDL